MKAERKLKLLKELEDLTKRKKKLLSELGFEYDKNGRVI